MRGRSEEVSLSLSALQLTCCSHPEKRKKERKKKLDEISGAAKAIPRTRLLVGLLV